MTLQKYSQKTPYKTPQNNAHRKPLAHFLLIAFLFTLTRTAHSQQSDTIKVGISGPLSGPTAWGGESMIHGTQAYFRKINETGVNGKKLELVSYDDGYEPSRTLENANKLLTQDKVFAFLSFFGGPTTKAVLPLVEKENVPLIGPISGEDLTHPIRRNVFKVRADSAAEAEAIVAHIVEQGIKDIGILYQDDVYGNSGVQGINAALAKHGLHTKVASAYKRNTNDIDEALETISKVNPKAVIMWGLFPATASFVKKAVAKKFSPIFYGAASVAVPVFFKETVGLDFNFYATAVCPLTTDTSLELVKNYLEDMKASGFADIHQYTLEAYVNARIFVEALKRAGPNPRREELRRGIESMKDVSVGGLSITFGPGEHQALKVPRLAHLEGGHLVRVPEPKK